MHVVYGNHINYTYGLYTTPRPVHDSGTTDGTCARYNTAAPSAPLQTQETRFPCIPEKWAKHACRIMKTVLQKTHTVVSVSSKARFGFSPDLAGGRQSPVGAHRWWPEGLSVLGWGGLLKVKGEAPPTSPPGALGPRVLQHWLHLQRGDRRGRLLHPNAQAYCPAPSGEMQAAWGAPVAPAPPQLEDPPPRTQRPRGMSWRSGPAARGPLGT